MLERERGCGVRPQTRPGGAIFGACLHFLAKGLAFAKAINCFVTIYRQIPLCSGGETRSAGLEPSDSEHRSTNMKNLFSRFIKDESGATAIEYGLIASLVSIAAIVAFKSVGTKLGSTFNDIANNLSS